MTFKYTHNVAKNVLLLTLILALIVSSIPASLIPAPTEAQAADKDTPFSWDNATIYFVMTDRFYDGDPSNNHSYGRELDRSGKPYPGYQEKIGSFHGGDLKGLTLKLNEGYFTDLGVNAIWITSPLEQIYGFVGGYSFRHYGYHGYFPLDFTEIDKNMGDTNDLRTFIDTAHSKGIRILFDVVINHIGYGDLITMDRLGFGDPKPGWQDFYYKDSFNSVTKVEPEAHFDNYTKFIGNTDQAAWARWWGPDWMRAHNTPGYAPCGTGELDMCLANLPDFKTESSKEVSLPPVLLNKWDATKEAKEIAELDAFFKRTGKKRTVSNHLIKWITDWVREYGVDGFRLDTAKHVENEVWAELKDEATLALREWKKKNPEKKIDDTDFWMTGEVFGHRVEKTSYFTEGKYDSIINFDFLWDDVPARIPNRMPDLEYKYSDYAAKMNRDPDFAVLNQLSSHDTTLYGWDFTTNTRNNMINAGTALLLAPGAAQIYYGDESGRPYGPFPNTLADQGQRCGRAPGAACDIEAGTRSRMNWNSMNQAYLSHWQKIGQFRAKHISIGAGEHRKLQYGPYAFERTYTQDGITDTIVAAIDAKGSSTIDVSSVWPNGTIIRDFYTGNTATVANGKVTFVAHANGVLLLENINSQPPQTAVYASPAGAQFTSPTLQVKMILRNATTGKYTVDGRDPKRSGVNFVSGDVVNFGNGMKIGDSVTLRLYTNGPTGESFSSYVYRKAKKVELTIHFKKPPSWGTPQLFYYDPKPNVAGVDWTNAPTMRDSGNGYFTYSIAGANAANILFKDRNGNQLPPAGQPGFWRTTEGYYDGTTFKDGSPFGSSGGGDNEPKPEPPPTVNPALDPPGNVRVTKQQLNSITLAWAPAESKDVQSYFIYRNGVKVGTSETTTFTDQNLVVDRIYEYSIRSIDGAGKASEPSEIIEAATLAEGDTGDINDPFIPTGDADDTGTETLKTYEMTVSDLENALTNINAGVIPYQVPGTEEELRVKIPGSIMNMARNSGAVTRLNIRTASGDYQLPVKEFDFQAMATEMKVSNQFDVYVHFRKANEQTTLEFTTELEKSGAFAVSDLRTVFVEVMHVPTGQVTRAKDYLSNIANRTIPTDSILSNSRLTVVQYNPETKRLGFAPAVFNSAGSNKVATVRLVNHPFFAIVDSSRKFSDLGSTPATIRSDIELLASKRLLNGVSANAFGPNRPVTRAEFATMLVNALGLTPDAEAADDFGDVWETHWFRGSVGAAIKYKLVAGFSDGTFRPFQTITRQQMTVMLGNAMRFARAEVRMTPTQISNLLRQYRDQASIANWARADFARAIQYGAFRPTLNNNGLVVTPNQQTSRAQAATAIKSMMFRANLMN